MRVHHWHAADEDGEEWESDKYVHFDGWRKAFDKEHLCFNTTKPPDPLVPLRHGYEYLVFDKSTEMMCVAIWSSASGWDGGCGCAHPDQLVHCLPEAPDNPEEVQ